MTDRRRLAGPCGRFVLLALALCAFAPVLPAQNYFGRNKVQYDDFDWRVLHTEHYDIHFYPEAQAAVQDAGRMSERWYTRLSSVLNHEPGKKPMVLYANHPDFQQTNVFEGVVTEGTGGVTEGLKQRVVMPFTGVYATFDHVLGHELVHSFQYDIAARTPAGIASMNRVPLWFIEGMAEYLSVGRTDPHTAMWLRDALLRNDLPSIDALSTGRYFPYRYGQAVWAFIGGTWGDRAVADVYRAGIRYGLKDGIQRVLGIPTDTLTRMWHRSIRDLYIPLIAERLPPQYVGRRIIGDPTDAGMYNLSPVQSPDGRYIAFYSSRGLFGIDLYLADARTGEVVRQLSSPETDAHFDALAFIYSAGTWSPDGRKLAFIVFAEGENQIAILDVASGDIDRRIAVRGVGAILDPAWSPDGRRLVFSGMSGGISDLYLLELATDSVFQLTDDRYADLQPAWAPDGGSIAWVTDRGPPTDFVRLDYAAMRLAMFDVASGDVRILPSFPGAKHINPQFSPDGQDLYFISDRTGFSNIYRLELGTGQMFQVTNVASGISGITELSPAMSVGKADGRLTFSIFQNSGFTIHVLDAAEARGTPVTIESPALALAGILPPATALERSIVYAYLEDPLRGLAQGPFRVTDYDSDLTLDYIGSPGVGLAVSDYGAAVGGGVAAYFSDLLGNRVVATSISTGGGLKDIGGQVFYLNRRDRWNWGGGAAYTPYLVGFRGIADTVVTLNDGNEYNALSYQTYLQRVMVSEVGGMTHYPFSATRRFEAQVSLTRVAYDVELHEALVVANQFVGELRRDLPAPESFNYGQVALALVGDNSNFGFTSPVQGQRYRFEVAPTFGEFTFQTALADYRRYLFWQPTTLAFRFMHYGRYGTDSENRALQPLYVGHENFIRGYSFDSFEDGECQATATDACPVFSRLVGSRIALVNLELRAPLLGPPQFGLIEWGFLPVEIGAFVDAGIAWAAGDTPRLAWDPEAVDRIPVVSTGLTSRINLFGYMILEVYYAYPFQRPEKGGHFGFLLSPGF